MNDKYSVYYHYLLKKNPWNTIDILYTGRLENTYAYFLYTIFTYIYIHQMAQLIIVKDMQILIFYSSCQIWYGYDRHIWYMIVYVVSIEYVYINMSIVTHLPPRIPEKTHGWPHLHIHRWGLRNQYVHFLLHNHSNLRRLNMHLMTLHNWCATRFMTDPSTVCLKGGGMFSNIR